MSLRSWAVCALALAAAVAICVSDTPTTAAEPASDATCIALVNARWSNVPRATRHELRGGCPPRAVHSILNRLDETERAAAAAAAMAVRVRAACKNDPSACDFAAVQWPLVHSAVSSHPAHACPALDRERPTAAFAKSLDRPDVGPLAVVREKADPASHPDRARAAPEREQPVAAASQATGAANKQELAGRRAAEHIDQRFARLWPGSWVWHEVCQVALATAAALCVVAAPVLWRRAAAPDGTRDHERAEYEGAHAVLRNIAVVLRPADDGRNVSFFAEIAFTTMMFASFGYVLGAAAAVALDDGSGHDGASPPVSLTETLVSLATSTFDAVLRWAGVSNVARQLRHFCMLSVGGALFYGAFSAAYSLSELPSKSSFRLGARCLRAHALAILLRQHRFDRARMSNALAKNDPVLGTNDATSAAADMLCDVGCTAERLLEMDKKEQETRRQRGLEPFPSIPKHNTIVANAVARRSPVLRWAICALVLAAAALVLAHQVVPRRLLSRVIPAIFDAGDCWYSFVVDQPVDVLVFRRSIEAVVVCCVTNAARCLWPPPPRVEDGDPNARWTNQQQRVLGYAAERELARQQWVEVVRGQLCCMFSAAFVATYVYAAWSFVKASTDIFGGVLAWAAGDSLGMAQVGAVLVLIVGTGGGVLARVRFAWKSPGQTRCGEAWSTLQSVSSSAPVPPDVALAHPAETAGVKKESGAVASTAELKTLSDELEAELATITATQRPGNERRGPEAGTPRVTPASSGSTPTQAWERPAPDRSRAVVAHVPRVDSRVPRQEAVAAEDFPMREEGSPPGPPANDESAAMPRVSPELASVPATSPVAFATLAAETRSPSDGSLTPADHVRGPRHDDDDDGAAWPGWSQLLPPHGTEEHPHPSTLAPGRPAGCRASPGASPSE